MARAARAALIVGTVVASAFCGAQVPATSGDGVPRVPNPSLVDPGALHRAVPSQPVPVPPAPQPVPVPPLAPRGEGDIALVLPLESRDYGRAAEAVRDGFLAAAQAAGESKRVRVIGHADDNVLGGFAGAESIGARVVVGPLVRDDVRTVVTSGRRLPLTLALNQLDDGTPLPPQLYTLALAIESDARVLARRMRADNVHGALVIGGEAPLMKRFASAFAAEWLLTGASAPNAFRFDASPDGLTVLRRELARTTADGALIALDGPAAALARSFVPRLPAYASSLVNQDLEPASRRDLEGVVFVDVPWLVTPDRPAFAKLPRRAMGNLVLDRLYALGLDAYAVARAFSTGVPERLEIAGATGNLTLDRGRQFVREGTVAVFRNGVVVPFDAR